MTHPPDPNYLPADRDAARLEDLERRQPPPAAVLSAEAAPRAWPGEDPSAGAFHYIGQALSPAEFKQYCLDYTFGSSPPSYYVWHHTYNPDASWAPVSSNTATWWDRNEQGMTVEQKKAKRKPQLDAIMRYYRDSLGWVVGPHIFTDDLFIWLFTPMWYIGIHANEGNSYIRSGKTRYSIGHEVIGCYDVVVWPSAVRAVAGWAAACVRARLNFANVYTAAPEDRPDLHDPQLSGHRDYSDKTCPGRAISNAFFVQAAVDGWSAYVANTPPGVTPPADPLRARTIPGPPGMVPIYCSIPVAEFYAARGGLPQCGYPLQDEYRSAFGVNRTPCAVLRCERVVIKESPQFGVEQALLSEARTEGWLP